MSTTTCRLTHAEHMATWRSWRDDCNGDSGCGFAMRDVDQCDRGHPDDGVTWCGACGHEVLPPRRLEPDELHSCRRCGFEACRCPSLEDVPYGETAGEPGYVA